MMRLKRMIGLFLLFDFPSQFSAKQTDFDRIRASWTVVAVQYQFTVTGAERACCSAEPITPFSSRPAPPSQSRCFFFGNHQLRAVLADWCKDRRKQILCLSCKRGGALYKRTDQLLVKSSGKKKPLLKAMKKFKKVLLAVPIFVVLCLYFFHHFCSLLTCYSKEETSLEFDHSALMKAPGIMFVETTDRVEPSPLAVCSVESASRRNPDKHVYYFLKGFSGNMSHYPRSQYEAIRVLSLLRNVTVFPLRLRALFRETPLNSWYEQVNPFWEKYWIHVLADACRLALLWKYGGVYLDTDIISLKPLELQNFLCAEGYQTANNAALGFEKNHEFIWECMQDYVRNYEGRTWGYQGPALMSRVLKRWCQSDDLGQFFNLQCKGVSYLSPNYFYPISYTHWESYFQHWKKSSIETFFSETIGAHIWNFKNVGQQKQVITGSGTLIEYFFSQHCPVTYKLLIKRVS